MAKARSAADREPVVAACRTARSTAFTEVTRPIAWSGSGSAVIGRALGQVGTNAGSEIMKGFNRPTTYSTPANQGMILYFLSDVYAPSSAQ